MHDSSAASSPSWTVHKRVPRNLGSLVCHECRSSDASTGSEDAAWPGKFVSYAQAAVQTSLEYPPSVAARVEEAACVATPESRRRTHGQLPSLSPCQFSFSIAAGASANAALGAENSAASASRSWTASSKAAAVAVATSSGVTGQCPDNAGIALCHQAADIASLALGCWSKPARTVAASGPRLEYLARAAASLPRSA